MLAEEKHAQGRILGEDSHNDNIAAFLDGFHQRAHTRLHAGNLESHLIPLVTEDLFHSFFQRLLHHVGGVRYATLFGLLQAQVADIGDKHLVGTTCHAKLCHQIADGTSAAHYYILALDIGAARGMRTYGRGLYHSTIVETHALGEHHHPVVGRHKIVLCHTIGLKSLHPQMFTHIVLSTLAGATLAAYQLGACRNVVAWLAAGHPLTYRHHHGRKLVALYHRIEGGGMEPMIRMYLTAADADAHDADKYLVRLEVFGLGRLDVLENNVFGRN